MKRRHAFNQIRREKSGRGKYQTFATVFCVPRKDAKGIGVALYTMDHLVRTCKFSYTLQQLPCDPPVSFRPGERAFLLLLARRKIVNAGPGGSVRRHRAVVIAACVVHVPEQRLGIESVLREPVGKRNIVKL